MQWEYRSLALGTSGFLGGKFDINELDGMMNKLGREGWELVTSFDTNQAYGSTREIVVIFKKPR